MTYNSQGGKSILSWKVMSQSKLAPLEMHHVSVERILFLLLNICFIQAKLLMILLLPKKKYFYNMKDFEFRPEGIRWDIEVQVKREISCIFIRRHPLANQVALSAWIFKSYESHCKATTKKKNHKVDRSRRRRGYTRKKRKDVFICFHQHRLQNVNPMDPFPAGDTTKDYH